MTVGILAFFASGGVPVTGLTPTISIWLADAESGPPLVEAAAMTEMAWQGGYSYEFSGHDPDNDYFWLIDGGDTLPDDDRMQKGSTAGGAGSGTPPTEIADAVRDALAVELAYLDAAISSRASRNDVRSWAARGAPVFNNTQGLIMPDVLYIPQGDTSPAFRVGPLFRSDGTTPDLTDAQVLFWMRRDTVDGAAIVPGRAMIVEGPPADHAAVVYEWQAGDTDTLGRYIAQVKVLLANGRVETFPSKGFVQVQVVPDLPGAT